MELSKCRELANELMTTHGLTDWTFQFDESVRRFGVCKYRPKVISLSWRLVDLNAEEKVRDTILHEIAHALTPKAGHGWKWKMKAIEIGCDGKRCYDSRQVITPKKKFKGVCPKCQREIFAHKRNKVSCGKCDRHFNQDLLIIWSVNDQ